MLERMETHGLKLSTDQTRIEDGIACDHSIDFDNQIQGMYKLAGEELRSITGIFDQLDVSVKRRWRDRPDYRPKNLSRRFRSKLDEWKT
jgi:hypothetical protein